MLRTVLSGMGIALAALGSSYGAQAIVAEFVGTLAEFPPRQRPPSFSVDQIMDNFQERHGQ